MAYVVLFTAPPEMGKCLIVLQYENGELGDNGDVQPMDEESPLWNLPRTKVIVAEINAQGNFAHRAAFDVGENVYEMEHLTLANYVSKVMVSLTGVNELTALHQGFPIIDKDELFTAP